MREMPPQALGRRGVARQAMFAMPGSIDRHNSTPFLVISNVGVGRAARGSTLSRTAPTLRSANKQIEVAHIETGLTIVLPAKLKSGKSVFVGSDASIDGLV